MHNTSLKKVLVSLEIHTEIFQMKYSNFGDLFQNNLEIRECGAWRNSCRKTGHVLILDGSKFWINQFNYSIIFTFAEIFKYIYVYL